MTKNMIPLDFRVYFNLISMKMFDCQIFMLYKRLAVWYHGIIVSYFLNTPLNNQIFALIYILIIINNIIIYYYYKGKTVFFRVSLKNMIP